ncbi:hypothetical protein ACE939_00965 [Aquimarina sp. W85]|uniref:hypothetical protein n=1 Tax=Aquimarina rhodophyticola TaxID=3342246 RepID=UPI00366CFB57
MKRWLFLGICMLGIHSLFAKNNASIKTSMVELKIQDEVTAVISKDTTQEDLNDLTSFFNENGIDLIVNKVTYNSDKEITGLSIILKKDNSKTNYTSSSNIPIAPIELGYKSGGLFISNQKNFKITTSNTKAPFKHPHINIDSLMQNHGFAFNFNFDKDTDSLFLKGGINLQELKDQIMNTFSFDFDEDDQGNFSFNGQAISPFKGNQRYHFIDTPDINKLIIIDGEESDFKTLDRLAKEDTLDTVDFLKPNTAKSIYGKKATDGAIIATTKK